MNRIIRRSIPAFIAGLALCAASSQADDMTSFATGGYARGLRTMDQMHMIDTDHDGSVSKAEWLAYQERVFASLDKNKKGTVDEKTFLAPSSDMESFATGGYARGLQTQETMHAIDTDHDGTVSHAEFIAYQKKVFDMMDTNKSGMLGPKDFLAKADQ